MCVCDSANVCLNTARAHTHTQVDAKDLIDDGANTLHADVDTRKCFFTGQPFYFTQVGLGFGFRA